MRFLKTGNRSTKSLAYTSLRLLILEYGASCLDPCREGQINALDHVQNKVTTSANDTKDSGWETFALRWKVARICAQFKAHTGERARKYREKRLKGSCYLSRDDHDRKIIARKQRTDIGKYCCVYRTIKLWNKLPAKALATFHCQLHVFRKRVRKVIINVEE
jgi:hypothetical protein